MEAVAVSAMNLGVKSAAIAITDEIGLLLGVPEELFFIKKEYEMMQAFLWTASTRDVIGPVMTTWVLQVQELASDVDNCLQEAFVLQMKKGCLFAMCSVIKRSRIARKIRKLKTRIEDVNKRYQRYNQIDKETINQLKTLKESCKKDKTALDQKLKRELMEELR